jgi:hypothetical protein
MMPENSNNFNGNNDPLKSGEIPKGDQLQDAAKSDAASENAREAERIQEAARSAIPAYQIDDEKLEKDAEARKQNEADTSQPLTTQGRQEEIEENFSGSTNLNLEQLKKEKDPGGFNLEGEEPEERLF